MLVNITFATKQAIVTHPLKNHEPTEMKHRYYSFTLKRAEPASKLHASPSRSKGDPQTTQKQDDSIAKCASDFHSEVDCEVDKRLPIM